MVARGFPSRIVLLQPLGSIYLGKRLSEGGGGEEKRANGAKKGRRILERVSILLSNLRFLFSKSHRHDRLNNSILQNILSKGKENDLTSGEQGGHFDKTSVHLKKDERRKVS